MLDIRRQWIVRPDPGQVRYLRWVSPLIGLPASVKTASGAPVDTAIVDEREAGGREVVGHVRGGADRRPARRRRRVLRPVLMRRVPMQASMDAPVRRG